VHDYTGLPSLEEGPDGKTSGLDGVLDIDQYGLVALRLCVIPEV
jgi:hypothetical protein